MLFLILFVLLLLAWIFSWAVFHVAGAALHIPAGSGGDLAHRALRARRNAAHHGSLATLGPRPA